MRVGLIGCGAAGTAVLDAVVRTAATPRRRVNAAIPARAADLVGTLLTSGLAVPHPHGGVGIQSTVGQQAVAHVFEKPGAIR